MFKYLTWIEELHMVSPSMRNIDSIAPSLLAMMCSLNLSFSVILKMWEDSALAMYFVTYLAKPFEVMYWTFMCAFQIIKVSG